MIGCAEINEQNNATLKKVPALYYLVYFVTSDILHIVNNATY